MSGFLDLDSLNKKSKDACVKTHELYNHVKDVTKDMQESYFDGCVLAALFDSGTISSQTSMKLHELGISLKLSTEDIDRCIQVVSNLSDAEKNGFVEELCAGVSHDIMPFFLLKDMERFIVSASKEESTQFFDIIGRMIYKSDDWQVPRPEIG